MTSIASSGSITPMKGASAGGSVHITDSDHPYMKNWWVPGLQIGYEHTFIHQFADFLQALGEGRNIEPTFRDGLATDYVIDSVLKSANTGRWENVPA